MWAPEPVDEHIIGQVQTYIRKFGEDFWRDMDMVELLLCTENDKK